MASISDQNGARIVQFFDCERKRRTLRLGKVSKKAAESIKVRIEHLVAASLTAHAIDDATAIWIQGVSPTFRAKLARVGLLPRQESLQLGSFLDGYIDGRKDVKERTRDRFRNTRKHLVQKFTAGRLIGTITAGDAEEWRIALVSQGLKPPTIGKLVKHARQFFASAVRKRLLSSNPFAGVKAPPQVNPSRYAFVPRPIIAQVLDACPDIQWRLIVALARFGGLRTPSEILPLKWSDIDWQGGRITVTSPKTEHHPQGEKRTIPLFPELRRLLQEAKPQGEVTSAFVITRYRDSNTNLRTQLLRIIARAGVEPWPKLFQNLRSTRETELAEAYPLHVVCAWIGNSQPVAAKHYLQVTNEHFAQAAGECSALQNALQQIAAGPRKSSRGFRVSMKNPAKRGVLREVARTRDRYTDEQAPPRGVEPLFSD